MRQGVDNTQMLITKQGAIASITIPEGWIASKAPHESTYLYDKVEVRPPGTMNTRLVFFRPNQATNYRAGLSFLACLTEAPHELSTSEIDRIRESLGNVGSAMNFQIHNACTQDLNGRKVIIIEGEWTHGIKFCGIFYDGGAGVDRGTVVHQIFFEGPPEEYASLLNCFLVALQSIEWTSTRS